MEDFNSKYTGEEVEQLLDQVANGGGGGDSSAVQSDWEEPQDYSLAYIKNRTHYFKPWQDYVNISEYDTNIGEYFCQVGEIFKLGECVYKSSEIVDKVFDCAPFGPQVFVSVVEDNDGYYLKFVDGTLIPTIPILLCGDGDVKPIDDVYIPDNVARYKDNYLYSNGEKVDMRFTQSLLPTGTEITANSDLNTLKYLRVGRYYCVLNASAKTITNCPTTEAFTMEVYNPVGVNVDDEETNDYVYRLRIITAYKTGVQYIQHASTGATPNKWTFDSWYTRARSKFTLNSSKKGGSAAIGTNTKPIYIDSAGEIKAVSYSLGASVPTGAVFTDTKVTAVDNHYTPEEDTGSALNAPEGEVVVGLKRDAAGHVVGIETTPQSGGGGGSGEGALTEAQIAAMGFTKNEGTITEVKMNGVSKGTSGVVDLGSVITEHQDISGKQDVITDIDTIRDNAVLGAKAVQPDNIKTINGQSIIGTGDIAIGGGGQKEVVSQFSSEITILEPNKIYVQTKIAPTLTIVQISTTGSLIDEYSVHFVTNSTPANNINIPDNVLWANGEVPTLEANCVYELSIVKTTISSENYFKAVLTKFA